MTLTCPVASLPLGALHEMAGGGPDVEQGAAAALLTAGIFGESKAKRPVLALPWR